MFTPIGIGMHRNRLLAVAIFSLMAFCLEIVAASELATRQPPIAEPTTTPSVAPSDTPQKASYSSCRVDGPYIAMTFDDGPHPVLTPRLLDMLKARGIKATFFLIGQNAFEYPDIVRRIAAEVRTNRRDLSGIRSYENMTSSLSKYASSLILLEWGAIMLYFNLSGRVSAFLHPNFRPLLWLVGVSLALTAVIIAFAHKSECCGADEALLTHDHGRGAHHHEHSHHGDQAHKGLTAASVMSFLVLCVPIALAAVISPDRFGETFLRNRGTIESVRLLPASDAKSAPQPIAEENSVSANSHSNALPSLTDNRIDAASTGPASAEPTLPTSDENPEESTAAEYQNPALRPDKEGNIHAEVIDLLYACEDPSMQKDFEGRQVAMIGQVAHRNKAQHERGPFQLVRFVMVCCAADVQPIAVLVQYPKTSPDFELMSWVKVIGKVRFQTVDDHLEPVVDALKVARIPQPADQYLY